VLLSTYDLGRQPFGLASPAAWLRRAGATVTCTDLSVAPLDEAAVRAADIVAFHLPMHTATRLAAATVPRVRALNPRVRLWFYGLYAPLNAAYLYRLGAEAVVGGEFEGELARRVEDSRVEATRPDERTEARVSVDRLSFLVPERGDLPPLSRYAHLHETDGSLRVVGATEASRGCKHQCRHCPVTPVYQGRFRIVQREIVLEDIRRQVAAGAQHMTFADPDFFNGIGHALPLVRSLHREHPTLTYDVTIKIEHLLRYREHLATLRDTGCRFVTSAVESVDDRVLERLDKGHTRSDFLAVVECFHAAGVTLNPTFVAFTPWTSRDDYLELLEVIADLGLVDHVAPVQLSMRLLIPAGSRLLELAERRDWLGAFDERALVHRWRHPDPEVDLLCERVQSLVREGVARRESRSTIFASVRSAAARAARRVPRPLRGAWTGPVPVPYLSEPWYC